MLVLTRNKDQQVVILDDERNVLVTIKVTAIRGNSKVSLAFDADRKFTIVRHEALRESYLQNK